MLNALLCEEEFAAPFASGIGKDTVFCLRALKVERRWQHSESLGAHGLVNYKNEVVVLDTTTSSSRDQLERGHSSHIDNLLCSRTRKMVSRVITISAKWPE
jgi:hypothetical protein